MKVLTFTTLFPNRKCPVRHLHLSACLPCRNAPRKYHPSSRSGALLPFLASREALGNLSSNSARRELRLSQGVPPKLPTHSGCADAPARALDVSRLLIHCTAIASKTSI